MNVKLIEVPTKYAAAFELALKHIQKAETKHPIFPQNKFEQLSILNEEVGEIARDMNDGKWYQYEIYDTIAVCFRMLAI